MKLQKLGLLSLMTILLAGMVYGACTFTEPTSATVYRYNNTMVNVTCADTDEVVNCSVTGTSAKTGDTTNIAVLMNYSDTTVVLLNHSWWTNNVSDADDYIISGTCQNESGQSYTITSVSGVTIDNSQPVCTWDSAFVSRTTYLPTQTWQLTGTNATSATLKFGSNAARTMLESAAGDVFTTSERVPESTYDIVVATTSDGLNETACTTLEFIRIDESSTNKQVAASVAASAGQKGALVGNNNLTAIIIIGIVGLWYVRRKKK